jgi:hypothetical protein
MMKVGSRFSVSLASAMFILLLCFVPGALGQSAGSGRAGNDSIVLSQTYPGILVFASNANPPQSDHRDSDHHDKGGCDGRDRDRRSNCTAVPEGGTALAYLSLVALGCLATGIFKSRRQASVRATR